MADDYLWDPAATPNPAIQRLEELLRPAAHVPVPMSHQHTRSSARWGMPRRGVIAATLLLATGALYVARRATVTPWEVSARQGAPVVRSASGAPGRTRLERNGVVETDARSSAVLTVGRIGRATIGPGSRLRLLGDDPTRHLLSLERGTMHASINAPPRYFVVQTASALAVDLGCVYTLSTDETGNGRLTVEEGEVELRQGATVVAVLAGNTASLRRGTGPGIPVPVTASEALRAAVSAYEQAPGLATLEPVLALADSTSTITLWHLLQRASPAERERVYARLASIVPPPATVTRDRVLRGESGALQRWRTDLQPHWASEPSLPRRLWLAFRP